MAAPVINTIADVSVPSGKTLLVPVSASDTDGNPLSYSISSDNNEVSSTVLSGGTFIDINTATYGDMVLRLLPEFAPNTVNTILGLINKGFYNGLTFHRVVPGFAIQGGDPKGNGSGGPGFTFDDEFNPLAIFSGNGQLAMANSGKDTNGSQFFITVGAQRSLDFNHTIFGQLVEGNTVLNAIDNAPNSGPPNNTATPPVKINSIKVISDTTDTVLLLTARASAGTTTFSVTANDGKGGTSTQTFRATVTGDTYDDPPILGPVGNQVTATGVPVSIPLTSININNDPLTYEGVVQGTSPQATASVSGNVVTVTPNAGFAGNVSVLVGVEKTGATTHGTEPSDPFDTQLINITVETPTLASQGVSPTVVAGQPVNSVATFTSSVAIPASNYTATVTWGDGTTSTAAVEQPSTPGHYVVTSTKAYDRAGSYPISVKIAINNTSFTTTATATVKVTDAPLSAHFANPAPAAGTLGVSGTIATFTDGNPNPVLTDLSATVAWGDGTTSPGTFAAGSNGTYTVSASKTYAADGSYPVKVTIQSAGGSSATAQGTIVVPNHAPTLAPIPAQTVQAGSTLRLKASATDIDPGQVLTYRLGEAPASATIDPHTGQFTWTPPVAGTTSATFTVTVTDNGTPALSASQRFSVTVTSPPPTTNPGGGTPAPTPTPQPQPLVAIVSVNVARRRRSITAITLHVNGALDATSAQDGLHYALSVPGRRTTIRLGMPQYEAASGTITLTPLRPVLERPGLTLTVTGLTDTLGRPFSAQNNGQAGGTFVDVLVPQTAPRNRRGR
jgi:cyclophilin family peptidyl-prolyl cis-trans isomerase